MKAIIIHIQFKTYNERVRKINNVYEEQNKKKNIINKYYYKKEYKTHEKKYIYINKQKIINYDMYNQYELNEYIILNTNEKEYYHIIPKITKQKIKDKEKYEELRLIAIKHLKGI